MRHGRYAGHIRKCPFAAAVFLALILAWMGCKAEETVQIDSESVAIPTEEVLARDSSYMTQLFNQRANGQPFINLDLGDERQYKFVINRLLQAGKSPSDSPRLFQRLRQIRAEHRASFAAKARAGGVKGSDGVIASSNAGGGGIRCGTFLIASGSNVTNNFVTNGSALMTCDGGADYFYVDEASYKTDEDESPLQFLASTYVEDFAATQARTPVLSSSVVAAQGFVTLNDSFGMGCDDTTGDCEVTYTKWKHDANTPATICKNNSLASLGDPASCQLDHPRDSTGDGIVRLCYQRTYAQGSCDCDYAAVNANGLPGVPPFTYIAMIERVGTQCIPSTTERWLIPNGPVSSVPNLFLPMMGAWDAGTHLTSGMPCKTVSFKPDDTWATVSLPNSGEWCTGAGTQIPDDNGQLFQNLRTNLSAVSPPPPRKVPFGEDASTSAYVPNLLVDFGPDCLNYLQDACMIVNISAVTTCPDPNNPSDKTRTATCEVCFDVKNSCFAAGTVIRRSDGTTVPVEQVEVGDRIVANEVGTLLTVTATTRGVEPEPMIRLRDSLGHELLLTAKHPVITTLGATPADEITTMSQVETEDGTASIVEVERVRYKGMVYNLSVGTPEEIAMVMGVNRTMFAGGIRVGDNEMQFDMERQSKRESFKREPSPAWEIDRKNALARKQRAARK